MKEIVELEYQLLQGLPFRVVDWQFDRWDHLSLLEKACFCTRKAVYLSILLNVFQGTIYTSPNPPLCFCLVYSHHADDGLSDYPHLTAYQFTEGLQ